jgi:osmotically-inducible protein OsmY
MAFRDFFRSERDRDRDEDERGRERWRTIGGDWRDENRSRREWERDEERGQGYGAERGWSPGSEHHSDRSQDYRADDDEGARSGERWSRDRDERAPPWAEQRGGSYGGGYGASRGFGRWSEDEQRYGGERSAGNIYRRYYGGGASPYTGSGYSGGQSRGAGRSYGEGGYGRDIEQGRRGAFGYGGYGGAETGSGALSSWQGDYGQGSQPSREGLHSGKGPRGYRRSDQRVKEDVCDCLTEDAYIDASNMEVAVTECQVTLSGTVNSREEKRRAEDLIVRILGVTDVTNNLRVAPPQQPTGTENRTSPSSRH